MKKKLQIIQPIINSYTSYGALFSILPDSAWSWVMNNFIQLNYVYEWDMVTFDCHRLLLSNCPAIDYYEERRVAFNSVENGLKQTIIDGIRQGFYLFMYADRYYIKVAEEYHKIHEPHEIFIYGYNLEEDKVYVGDNLEYGKFIFTMCTFSELTEAYKKIDSDRTYLYTIRYLKVHENTDCDLNLNQIISGIEAYLNSYETFEIAGNFTKMDYGISIVDKILAQVASTNNNKIDIRFFHLFYEHKLLMEMRICYLVKNNYIAENEIDLKDFSDLKSLTLILRNLVLKYNLMSSSVLLDKIYNKLLEIRKKDVMLLSHLLWVLSQKQ